MRKEATIIIDAPGRDQGKVYRLKELSASQAEAWGARLMLALSRAGVEVPDGFLEMGMAGVAAMGLRAMGGLSWDVAKPLLDEMMTCIQIQPNPGQSNVVRPMIEDDIEEVSTRVRLREEVITLHTSFSIREFISNLKNSRAMEMEQARLAAEAMIGNGGDTATSPSASDVSSLVN